MLDVLQPNHVVHPIPLVVMEKVGHLELRWEQLFTPLVMGQQQHLESRWERPIIGLVMGVR